MKFFARRLALLLSFLSFDPAVAQTAAAGSTAPATPTAAPSWLYKGSDVPPDPAWIFGELPNGLRYAVRRNGVPPHQVSIRMAIDAGSLMERPGESGFAHYNEHLSFRGSKYVPDGEAKRLWQRLGATFGSDTNATTSPTQTIYKLDLPAATPDGIDESLKVLSGMMAAPDITQAEVDAERRTVLAELREGSGPSQRVGDATRDLFFAGQPLGAHSSIGEVSDLNAATPAALRAFHDRWYRPERAVLVVVGDADPATFETLIRKYFADWKGIGPAPADVDFGKPNPAAKRAKVVVEPGLPLLVNLAVLRPWVQKNDTIEYNRGKLVETLALRLISRRLETRARAGASFLQAQVSQDDISRSVDGTFIQVVPVGEDWQAAVRDVRATIADALANPSSQEDIDREAEEFATALQADVEQAAVQNGSDLADTLVEAVNIRETVASPEVARDVFGNMKDRLNPKAILAATRRMFAGVPMRAFLTSPHALSGSETKLLAAMTVPVKPGSRASIAPVSFDKLPALGAPGTVINRLPITDLGLEFVEFSNGVKLVLFANPAETGRVYVSARFGHGMQALPSNRFTDAWTASSALVPSGVGDLGQDALDRLVSGRRIGLSFGVGDSAFQLRATTRAADLDDQLKLLAAKLEYPGWDPAPVLRARAASQVGYATTNNSPNSVVDRELPSLLHGGDPRWATPTPARVALLTPQSFRSLWEPLLKTGPIELMIFGDVDPQKAIDAAAATFGALKPRENSPVSPFNISSRSAVATPTPLVFHHTGPADQAAAVLAWPTAGGLADIYEGRKLDVLAAIFSDRIFEQLREAEGASYSPNVGSDWPTGMDSGGSLVVTAQLKPEGVDRFFALSRSIAADFVAKPVTADELARAVGPMRQQIARASSGNLFWMAQLGGSSRDPRRIVALTTLVSDLGRITPADLQETAKRWLVPGKELAMIVLPTAKAIVPVKPSLPAKPASTVVPKR